MRAYKRRSLDGLRPALQSCIVVEHDGEYFVLEDDGMRRLPDSLVKVWDDDRAEMDSGTHPTWVPL